ncbi:hypothetical protein L6252_01725 [Candidatus Parcubacteria bacterium]|nr:hypothetical protein [Candidatus Parcubacteria bacterium]
MPKQNDENDFLTKGEFRQELTKALSEQSKAIIEAVDFGFQKMGQRIDGVEQDIKMILVRLTSIEKRVMFIEDVITRHSKEIVEIKEILKKHSGYFASLKKELKSYKGKAQTQDSRILNLEQRVARLEASFA